MPRILSPKEIEARKFWRLTDSTDDDKEVLRSALGTEVSAFLASGGKVVTVPVGVSGIKASVFASYAKAQANGLKKLNVPKKRGHAGG
jgi:hypothetical protein